MTRTLNTAQEQTVTDINLWLYHRAIPDANYHLYLTSTGSMPLSIVGGEYDYYAVANIGKDLGMLRPSEASAYTAPIAAESDLEKDSRLLMSTRGTMNALQGTRIPITLSRCSARLEFTLDVSAAMASQITVTNIQVMNVPSSLRIFGDNHPADLAGYFDYASRPYQSGAQHVFYLPENTAGSNTAITNPRNKDKHNAPKGATYIRISAATSAGRVEYYIFPGANSTSDFNVRRNNRYVISATITGLNSIDTRMSVTQMNAEGWASSYTTGSTANGRLNILCTNNPDNWIDLSYTLTGGGTLLIDGASRPAGQFFRVMTGSGSVTLPVSYVRHSAGNTSVQFTLRDRYGCQLNASLSTAYKLPYESMRVTWEPWAAQLDYYDTGTARLSISESGYTGNFDVTCHISGPAVLYQNNRRIFDGETVSLAAGSHIFELSPRGNGSVTTAFTVKDSNGQSTSRTMQTEISGQPDSLLRSVYLPLENGRRGLK